MYNFQLQAQLGCLKFDSIDLKFEESLGILERHQMLEDQISLFFSKWKYEKYILHYLKELN